MSYEFNPQSPSLELPNPYLVENTSLFASGAAALLCALLTLLAVRSHFAATLTPHGMDVRTLACIALALVLLWWGFSWIATAASQLRFYFGRNRPHSLAETLSSGACASGEAASSAHAEHYKECLRHGALSVAEPQGAINGVLYSWFPNLIFAPTLTQNAALRQVKNFLGLGAITLSFLVSWASVGSNSAWVGLVYAALGLFCLHILGDPRRNDWDIDPHSGVDASVLSALLLLSVLGPVIFSSLAEHLALSGGGGGGGGDAAMDGLTVNAVVLAAMLLLLASIGIYLMALRQQLAPAPQEVGCARSAQTVTMNAHPAKIMEELDRVLMRDWFERIPNRRYSYSAPHIAAAQGEFTGDLLEEVQPRPKPRAVVQSLGEALAQPYFRWLALLSLFAAVCMTLACFAVWRTGADLLAAQSFGVAPTPMTQLILALCLVVVGNFARHNAHQLWGRFDFVSELIWVELAGSFESAQLRIGNQISGQIQSDKQIINVEAMTLRVWVSEIESVIFGKDARRQVIRMRALPERAEQIARELKLFAETRSMVVAPTSVLDQERLNKMRDANVLLGRATGQKRFGTRTQEQVLAAATAARGASS